MNYENFLIDDSFLEKVIPNNSYTYKNPLLKKDFESIEEYLKDLYEGFTDKYMGVAVLKELNSFLRTVNINEDQMMSIIFYDFYKVLVLFLIPVNFTVFHIKDLPSKVRAIIIYELREKSLELLEYLKVIKNYKKKKKEENEPQIVVNTDFLFELNKMIFGRKNYDIINKVNEVLIKKKNLLKLSDLIRITYESVLFNIVNGEAYGEREIIKHKWTKPNVPFLPEQSSNRYTLVLDLDETLIHSEFANSDSYYLVRPGALYLLSVLSEFYEIVIFTTGTQDYADSILDALDLTGHYISHRLFRQHTTYKDDDARNDNKDITKLGRSLASTIIVDNVRDNFALHPDNGLYIKTWESDIEDFQLYGLTKLLQHIAKVKFTDIRDAIHIIAKQLKDRDIDNLVNPYDEVYLNQ